jgi:hypothetical protein
MDFLTSSNKYRVFAEISRQGSNIAPFDEGQAWREKESFNWFMQMFLDQ